MTVPKFMEDWSVEECTQEQFDWLMENAKELRNLEQVISPLFSRAWEIMSELQSVVDEAQEWTSDIPFGSPNTSTLFCYHNGTLEQLREIQRIFGI